MIVANLKALEGLVWGTALGDGLHRMHRFRKPPFLLHSASGTWFLSVFQAVFEPGDLSTKLQVLATPRHGMALRGDASALAGTLLEASNARPSHRLLGDILPCMTPLAFLSKDESSLVEKLIDWTHVTHWHPRVISSVALLVGALRALLMDAKLPLEGQLQQGELLADRVLHRLFERKEADTPQAIWTAHQALRHHVAVGKGAVDPVDLQFPAGFDGRDSPEQIVIYALALSCQVAPAELKLNVVLENGSTSDILAPLVGGLIGFHEGISTMPPHSLQIMLSKSLWSRHLTALAQRDFYFPALAEAEITLTLSEESALKELDHFQSGSGLKNQLALFEDKIIKRESAGA
ncbi:MAG: hypothetical protein V4534_03115 [Myxococcota bacterium]